MSLAMQKLKNEVVTIKNFLSTNYIAEWYGSLEGWLWFWGMNVMFLRNDYDFWGDDYDQLNGGMKVIIGGMSWLPF